MKKKFTILSMIMIFLITNTINALAYTKDNDTYWFKGYGVTYNYSIDGGRNYNITNFEWATITAHAFYPGTGSTGRDRVRVFTREDSPKYIYGSDALVRTIWVRSGLRDDDVTRNFFEIISMTPIESSTKLLTGLYYDLLGLFPWQGAGETTTVLDALSNVITASIQHWTDDYKKIGNVQAYHYYDIDNLNLANNISASQADQYSDYIFDEMNKLSRGFTGHFIYDFGAARDYRVKAWGQVMYRVQTENGNGFTVDIVTGTPTVSHTINTTY